MLGSSNELVTQEVNRPSRHQAQLVEQVQPLNRLLQDLQRLILLEFLQSQVLVRRNQVGLLKAFQYLPQVFLHNLDIRRLAQIKEKEEVIGNRTRVKVVKNKVAPPFREVEFDIIYNEGISQVGEVVDLGVDHGIVDKAGAWYAFRGERIGQGREAAKQYLKDNPQLAQEIRGIVMDTVGITNTSMETADIEVEEFEDTELENPKKGRGRPAANAVADEPAAF